MTPAIASAFLPALRRIDPERAHRLALQALKLGLAGRAPVTDDPVLATTMLGRTLRNPIGLAAGFDKDAVAAPGLFRLEGGAVINRMGMNNRGIAAFVTRLAGLHPPDDALLGLNVGINKDGADPERDYPDLVAAVAPYAAYITLNVSSPNTVGLRALQEEAKLRAILQAVAQVANRPPIFVKIAPDLPPGSLESVVQVAVECDVAGLIVSNTTVSRPPELRGRHIAETGGLSGPPLLARSTALLAQTHKLAAGRLTLIGCGGVSTGEDVLAKLRAGAHMVQLYAAFAVHGPALLPRIKAELATALRREGFRNATEAVGSGA